MLKVSDSIKNAYNQYTTQRKSYIRAGDNSFFVQNLDVQADAYDEGNVIGNAIAKIAKFDIETDNVKGLNEFELFDGIWTGNQYEYVSLGTFKLYDEEGTDDFFSTITAYDKLILFNKPYNPSLTNYPTTIFGLLQNICEQAGVEVENLSIANGNQELLQNLFVEGETLKQILKAILQISGTFGVISQDKLKLTLKNEDSIQLENYQISEPEYKRTTWSINQVVLGMSDVDGEYVQLQDEEDVEINGIHKLVINDNPFVYTQELRQSYISELFEQVKGFGYIAFESKWEGMPFVELGDFLNIGDKESLVLRYNLKSPDGLNSTISAPSLIDSVVEYVNNSDSIENKQKKTEARVDKAEGNIILLTKTTKEIGNNLSENYYSKINVNELIQNAETGVTNTFSEAGGNNVLRNTGLWFTEQETYKEEQTINLLSNKNYTYCENTGIFIQSPEISDSGEPIINGYKLNETFTQTSTEQDNFRLNNDELIEIESGYDYKYTYQDVIEGYDICLYQLDENLQFIPYNAKKPVYTTLTQNTNVSLSFDDKAKYLTLVGIKTSSETRITLDTAKEKLNLIELNITKNVDVIKEKYEFWDGNVVKNSNYQAVNNNSMLLQNGTLYQEQEVPNGNYSISFYYQKLNQLCNASVVINDIEYQLNSTEVKQFYTGEQDSETGEYIVQPIVVSSNHINIKFKCDANNGIEIWDLMCNKGTVKLAYSQNENETTTETVNISKGITITSTNMETIFKANANGIRILTLQKAAIAYFTDKGLSTNELIVKEEAQMCGTLVQEVGEQTWFTRM